MSNQQKIYCIPGFGTDEKIFSHLKLNAAPVFLNWLHPNAHETLQSYIMRMAAKIQEPNPTIVGLSFGGMIAVEMNKFFTVKNTILISSIKTKTELPLSFKWAGLLKLNHIFPYKTVIDSKWAYYIANKRLGAKSTSEKEFANRYRRFADIEYAKWSFEKILNWKNEIYPSNIIQINGDADQIFPIKYIHPTHIIKGGTHMMIFNRADEISTIINHAIQ